MIKSYQATTLLAKHIAVRTNLFHTCVLPSFSAFLCSTETIVLYKEAFRSSHRRCFIAKLFLKISQNSQETSMTESLFNKAAGLRYEKNRKRCFPVNFAKFLRAGF